MFKYRIRKAQTYSFGAVFGEQTESENDCIKQHPLRFPKGCPEPGLSPHDASNGFKAGGDGGERDAMKEKAKLFYLEPQEFYFSSKEKETIIHSSCGPSPSLLCPRYAIVFLLFRALEAWAQLRRRRIEDLNRWRIFILGIEGEEEGSEVFINNKSFGLLKLRCFLCVRVTQSMTASPCRSVAC